MRIMSFSRKILSAILIGVLSSVEQLSSAEEMETVIMDINIDYSNDPFYSELWFWILNALIFLFFLILLIRGGRKKIKPEQEN